MSGYRSLYLKQLYKNVKAQPMDWLIIAFASLGAIGLLSLGIVSLYRGNSGGFVPLIFGLISVRFIWRDIAKFIKGPVDKKHWLFNHISGMIGSYIAGFTAFLAVNAGYITHDFSLIAWLTPTAIGVPLIIYWIRKYKVKKEDLSKELGLKIKTTS